LAGLKKIYKIMKYAINTITNQILGFDVDDFNKVSKNFRTGDWRECTEEERDDYLLGSIKDSKEEELKQKRDESNISEMTTHEGIELIPNELGFTESDPIYFSFRTKPTGNPATEPTSILSNVVVKNIGLVAGDLPPSHYLPYSCEIIEGETRRRGYIKLDFVLAQSLVTHLEQRNSANIKYCNSLEVELDNATTIEEINNINWD
jgi:hypothetical protein